MSHMPLTRLHLFIFRNLAILNEITECNSAAVAFINSKGVLVAFGWHWHWHWGSFSCQHWLTLALVPVLFLSSLGFRSCAVASLPIEAGCDCVNDIPTTIVDLVKVRIYWIGLSVWCSTTIYTEFLFFRPVIYQNVEKRHWNEKSPVKIQLLCARKQR